MNYLVIDGALLRNKRISPGGKLILQYFNNLQKSGRCYFGSVEYLADQLGFEIEFCSKLLALYFKLGLIRQDSDGIRLNHDFSFYSVYAGNV